MEVVLNPAATGLAPYPMSELAALARQLRSEGREVFDFGIGDPLEPTPHFIRQALIDGIPEVSQYPTVWGQERLRAAAAGWVQRRFGVELDPAREVMPSSGSKEAIFHLALVAIDPSSDRRAVLYGEPGYPVYERGAALCGAEPVAMALTPANGFLLAPWDLPASAQDQVSTVWVNYPHNPSGAVAPRSHLERLLDWCRERGALLCADECYIDTYYDDPPVSLLEVAGADRTNLLCFFSCSKRSGMTGYRSGFVAGDVRVLGAYAALRAAVGTASADFVQHAATYAWGDDKHAAQRRTTFAAKRAVLADLFGDIGVIVHASEAAFYLWIEVPAGHSSDTYCRHLTGAGILATPGGSFGPSGEGFVRLALAPTLDEVKAAARAWRELETAQVAS